MGLTLAHTCAVLMLISTTELTSAVYRDTLREVGAFLRRNKACGEVLWDAQPLAWLGESTLCL